MRAYVKFHVNTIYAQTLFCAAYMPPLPPPTYTRQMICTVCSTESHDEDGEEEDGESEEKTDKPSARQLLREWYSDPTNLKRVIPDLSVLQRIASQKQTSVISVQKELEWQIRRMLKEDAFPQDLEEGYVFEKYIQGTGVLKKPTHFMLMRRPLAEYPAGLAALTKGLETLVEKDADHLIYGGANPAAPRHDFRALTASENMQAMTTSNMVGRLDSLITGDTDGARIRTITADRFKPNSTKAADDLYQEFTSSQGESAREQAKRHLLQHIVATDTKFGPEAEYLLIKQPQARRLPTELKYMWSGYKPAEAERFTRLSEVEPDIFKGTGHKRWKSLIEQATTMVDLDTGTVFQSTTLYGFHVVSVKIKNKIGAKHDTETGGGGGVGHGEERRYDVEFRMQLPATTGKRERLTVTLHRLMVGCILKSVHNFPPGVTRFEGDHVTGFGHQKRNGHLQ